MPDPTPTASPRPQRPAPRRKRSPLPPLRMQLNLTAMIDVVFLLLVYFVVTANFNPDEGILTSKLPASTGEPAARAPRPPRQPLRIVLSAAGHHGYRLRLGGMQQAPRDFAHLIDLLERLQHDPDRGRTGAFAPDNPVIIQTDGRVRWQHVVDAFNAAVTARYSDVRFADPDV